MEKVKIFYDTEFIDDGATIDLISIGLTSSIGDSLYLISRDFNLKKAFSNKWLVDNILKSIYWELVSMDRSVLEVKTDEREFCQEEMKELLDMWGASNDTIALMIEDFIVAEVVKYVKHGSGIVITKKDVSRDMVSLFAYYSSYDHVVLAQLWGPMLDLPSAIPMFTNDIMTIMEYTGFDKAALKLAVPQTGLHNALADAEWNKRALEHINSTVNV